MARGRIRFDQVWKRFHRGPAHDSLRDLIPALIGRRTRTPEELAANDFWALQDVSFEVQPGESLGIIGGNGAGKSTTLKLLTRILQPTRGAAEVIGRVGSLIEVSAGFHPDLSGRENVFLQGAIMGMPQELIRRRFDEIVEFSGIGDFIDAPVKRYSSGMNARLGFSIAVHLEPEVLIIDEVLSVGDAAFQRQAFGRIKRLVQGEIPVVIVSHQLERIVELCTECILLSSGRVTARGRPAEVVQRYLGGDLPGQQSETALVDGVQLTGLDRLGAGPVPTGRPLTLRLHGTVEESIPEWLHVCVEVHDAASNARLYSAGHAQTGILAGVRGRFSRDLVVDANLPAGAYRLQALIWNARSGVTLHGPAFLFEVTDAAGFLGTNQLNLRAAAE